MDVMSRVTTIAIKAKNKFKNLGRMAAIARAGLVLALTLSLRPAAAQLDVWSQLDDANWDDASNWSQGVPTTFADVLIANGSTVSYLDNVLTVNSITLDGGSSLIFKSIFAQTLDVNLLQFGGTANSSLRFDGNLLTLTSRVLVDGSGGFLGDNTGDTLYSNAVIDANVIGGKLTIQSSNFYNNGALQANGGTLAINSATWFNTGSMSTSNGGTKFLGGPRYNSDSVSAAIHSVGGTHNAILTGTLFDGSLLNSNSLQIQNGTLTFVKMDAGLTLTNGYTAFIGDGVTFGAGSVTTIDNGSQMVFSESRTQALSSGAIFFDGNGNGYLKFDFRTLTLDTSEIVHGSAGFIGTNNLDTLINNGLIDADVPGGALTVMSANLSNNGTLKADSGSLTINSGAWTNNGNVIVTGQNAVLVVANAMVNAGAIRVDAHNTLELQAGLTQTTGATLVDGMMKFVIQQPIFALQGGTLSGSGVINGNVNNSGGTLQPGDVLGALTLNGNYSETAAAKTLIQLGGTQQGINYDLLKVLDSATLAGELDVKLVNGFLPYQGETFDFLTYTERTGTYSGVVSFDPGYGYGVTYNDSTGVGTLTVLVASAVPEASTVLSLTLMLATGGLLLRRKHLFPVKRTDEVLDRLP